MGRTTIIYSPHPDDETLRMTGYISAAAARGDQMILVSVSSGGASGAKPSTWSVQDLMTYRLEEQRKAWAALTHNRGQIIQLGLPDGAVSAAKVTAVAKALDALNPGNTEHYCACNKTDAHPDHRAVAAGVAALGAGHVVRYGRAPDDTATTGTVYHPLDMTAATAADNAYSGFGWKSVTTLFNLFRSKGYISRIIA